MSETSTANGAGWYEIRIQGHLETRWAAWFDGMRLTNASDGSTVVHGIVTDQAALHGLLQRVRDLGLPLISVTRSETDPTDGPTTESRSPVGPPQHPTPESTQQRKTT